MVIASDDNGQDSSGSGDSGSSEDGSAGEIFKTYICVLFLVKSTSTRWVVSASKRGRDIWNFWDKKPKLQARAVEKENDNTKEKHVNPVSSLRLECMVVMPFLSPF